MKLHVINTIISVFVGIILGFAFAGSSSFESLLMLLQTVSIILSIALTVFLVILVNNLRESAAKVVSAPYRGVVNSAKAVSSNTKAAANRLTAATTDSWNWVKGKVRRKK